MTQHNGCILPLAVQGVDDIVDKAGIEDVEVEEVGKVDTAVQGKAVAQLPRVDIAEGTSLEKGAQRGVEQRVAEVTSERVPHGGTFFVNRRAISVSWQLTIQRLEAIVSEMSVGQDAEKVLAGIISVSLRIAVGIKSLDGDLLTERGSAFINPHVVAAGARHQIAKPRVGKLVRHGGQTSLVLRSHTIGGEGNVADMLHRALWSGDIAYPVPQVWPKATLEGGDDLAHVIVYVPDTRTVVAQEAKDGGIDGILALVAPLDYMEWRHGDADKIGGRRPRQLPIPSAAAVGMVLNGV